jgi:hypothetical protein
VLKLSQRYSKQSRYWEFSFSFQNCAHGSISHRTSDIRDFSCTLENKKTLHESTLDVLKDAWKHYHQLGYAGSVAILKTAIALSLLNQTQLRAVGRRCVSVVAFPHNCNPCCSDPLALAATQGNMHTLVTSVHSKGRRPQGFASNSPPWSLPGFRRHIQEES